MKKKTAQKIQKTNYILDSTTGNIVFSSKSKDIVKEVYEGYSSNRYKLFINAKQYIKVGNE